MNTPDSPPACSGACPAKTPVLAFGWWASLAISLPMWLLSALLVFGRPEDLLRMGMAQRLVTLAVWLGINGAFLAMLRTGRTDRIRATLFITMAVGFVLSFIPNLIELRGSMTYSAVDIWDNKTPFCHMVIPMTLIPAALKQTIIFPGSLVDGFAAIGTMHVIWLTASLTRGRGWCSWVCFYGGLDEGCSRLRRKPVIRAIDRRWTYVPVAVLLSVMLLSALTLSPTYCEWLCPFKAVTEFETITSFKVLVQTVIFASLFVGLVIVLPILTKKRTQCALFCPMGAFQGWTNHLNLHRIEIDRDRCVECGLCVKACPTLSLTPESVAEGRALSPCTKCGRCIDACPKQAIRFHVRGTQPGGHPRLARVLFLYPAMLFYSAMGSHMIIGALMRLVKLISTGSMI